MPGLDIIYVANIRFPTEKAHGVAVMKMCGAFARAGVPLRLVVTRRFTPIQDDPREHYDVPEAFPITRLAVVDPYPVKHIPKRVSYWIETLSFNISLLFWMLFRSRKHTVFTRDILSLFLAFLGFRVVYECHALSRHTRIFFFLARRASRIVVISEALRESFIRQGFNKEEVLLAPSGVDLQVFDVAISKEKARWKLGLPADRPILLYTGNFTTMGEDKGIADIIAALPLIPEALFVAVGGSPEDIVRYETLAKERGVIERVMLKGRTKQKEFAVYQKAADALLMPFPDTPHYRGHMSPVKMVEYMAGKRPIIASDLPTIREVLDDSNAYIISPGSPEEIASAAKRIFEHPDEAKTRAEEAYEKVQEGFAWETRTLRILEFISKTA